MSTGGGNKKLSTVNKMSTLKQKKAITKTCENLRNNTLQPMGEVMLEAGYSKSVSKHPKILTESNTWKLAMAGIDFIKHLKELDEMASVERDEEGRIIGDKDNILKSKKMLFDIGDKFPTQKTKVTGLFGVIDGLKE